MAENNPIRQAITELFNHVAHHGPQGCFAYPSGEEALHSLGYPVALLDLLPVSVLGAYCGIGNIFSPAHLRHGESVLDMGCGAGCCERSGFAHYPHRSADHQRRAPQIVDKIPPDRNK